MKTALYRATVFLGYAVKSTEGAPLESVRLQSLIELSVGVPDPLPVDDRAEIQQQFRSWSIGQCLIELDQSYQRFVVSALETQLDLESFKHTRAPSPDKKPNLANTWTVHSQFHASRQGLGDRHEKESAYLRTLGNARNCLAHDSGLVSQRRLTEEDRMPVRWRGRDLVTLNKSGQRTTIPRDVPHLVKKEDVGRQISVEEVEREQIYRAGDRIKLSATDLSEIIFFYQELAMTIGAAMHAHVHQAIEALN